LNIPRALRTPLAIALVVVAGVATATVPPDQLLRTTSEEVLAIVRSDPAFASGDSAKLGQLVEEKVLGHFDFSRMTRLAVGKDWRQADSTQQEALTNEFRTLLVRTYSVALAQVRDHEITYLPLKAPADAPEVVVQTKVAQDSGKPIRMDYRMIADGDEWKVYDIMVDGVSLVVNYRSQFNATVASSGIDGLVQLLRDKNASAQ